MDLITIKLNNQGQSLVESTVALLLLSILAGGFFVFIYRTSLIFWTEYHLNQAINCENSKVLQTKAYVANKAPDRKFSSTSFEAKNPYHYQSNKPHHRKNKNCLAKAKADIQKIIPWEKIEVKRRNYSDEYEVHTKWTKSSTLSLEASKLNTK
jgi:hypothetical protein